VLILRRVLIAAAVLAMAPPGVAAGQLSAPPVFRWAGDPEGGAPFVEADPSRPDALVGFDVEIADLIARGLGRRAEFVNIQFQSIDQSIARGDAEIGLSGIEDTPARRAALAVTVPYYEFREVISVRDADAATLRTLADLRGRRVGTLGGTIAYEILLRAQQDLGIQPVSYEDDVHPFSDLVIGRVDAVVLDNVLANRRRRAIPGFTVQPHTVAIGHYVGVMSPAKGPLRETADEILRTAMRDGTLQRIFTRWNVWDEAQPKLFERVLAGEAVPAVIGFDTSGSAATMSQWDAARRYLPSLVRASGVTIALSCLSMGLAVALGVLIATGRVYGGRASRIALTAS
jgi:polar amino acid transport system substrate-binding protein